MTPTQDILIADRPVEFATQVIRLLRDPALRHRLAINARCLVEEQHNWEQIGQQFAGLVKGVAEG